MVRQAPSPQSLVRLRSLCVRVYRRFGDYDGVSGQLITSVKLISATAVLAACCACNQRDIDHLQAVADTLSQNKAVIESLAAQLKASYQTGARQVAPDVERAHDLYCEARARYRAWLAVQRVAASLGDKNGATLSDAADATAEAMNAFIAAARLTTPQLGQQRVLTVRARDAAIRIPSNPDAVNRLSAEERLRVIGYLEEHTTPRAWESL